VASLLLIPVESGKVRRNRFLEIEEPMDLQAQLFELLLAGFFAIACFRARANKTDQAPHWKDFFYLTNRLERLRTTKWQWCCMVALLMVVRQQAGVPVIFELTVLAQLVVFMSLPTGTPSRCAAPVKAAVARG
jgi:hypothetical protein